jgi:hypothetical protein
MPVVTGPEYIIIAFLIRWMICIGPLTICALEVHT